MNPEIDYAASGLDIRQSKVDYAKKHAGDSTRANYILWNGIHVKTSDWWDVPKKGFVKIEFLSSKSDVEQGVDVKIEDGWLELSNGEHIETLRTWKNEKYDDIVEYEFFSEVGRICIWNVYKMIYPMGKMVEERWTGNAGFWVEYINDRHKIYHCSHGMADEPDFESLVFTVSVAPGN